jgi:hypothetical protein
MPVRILKATAARWKINAANLLSNEFDGTTDATSDASNNPYPSAILIRNILAAVTDNLPEAASDELLQVANVSLLTVAAPRYP